VSHFDSRSIVRALQDARAFCQDFFAWYNQEHRHSGLGFVVSNCSWKGGKLTPEFRQPFDMLAVASVQSQASGSAGGVENGQNENWLPGMDSNHDSRLQRPLSYR
jgi:Integrase core domain